jgi:hypothetical protein
MPLHTVSLAHQSLAYPSHILIFHVYQLAQLVLEAKLGKTSVVLRIVIPDIIRRSRPEASPVLELARKLDSGFEVELGSVAPGFGRDVHRSQRCRGLLAARTNIGLMLQTESLPFTKCASIEN